LAQQTVFLLRSIWDVSTLRENILVTFYQWVKDRDSRTDVQRKLKAMIQISLLEESALQSLDVDLEQVHWGQLTEFFCECYYRNRFRRPLPDVPSDLLWAQLSAEDSLGPLSVHPQQDKAIRSSVRAKLVPLEQRLCAHGGMYMDNRYEPDLDLLLQCGEIFEGTVELVPGEPRQCHANTARLWQQNPDTFAIAIGYVISKDSQQWIQHSWLIRKQPTAEQHRIIETTTERIKYFGVILTDDEAQGFMAREI
jgi:hypothetical protein